MSSSVRLGSVEDIFTTEDSRISVPVTLSAVLPKVISKGLMFVNVKLGTDVNFINE